MSSHSTRYVVTMIFRMAVGAWIAGPSSSSASHAPSVSKLRTTIYAKRTLVRVCTCGKDAGNIQLLSKNQMELVREVEEHWRVVREMTSDRRGTRPLQLLSSALYTSLSIFIPCLEYEAESQPKVDHLNPFGDFSCCTGGNGPSSLRKKQQLTFTIIVVRSILFPWRAFTHAPCSRYYVFPLRASNTRLCTPRHRSLPCPSPLKAPSTQVASHRCLRLRTLPPWSQPS